MDGVGEESVLVGSVSADRIRCTRIIMLLGVEFPLALVLREDM